jgi:hypothetical protein
MRFNEEKLKKVLETFGWRHGVSTPEELERTIRLMPKETQAIFINRFELDGDNVYSITRGNEFNKHFAESFPCVMTDKDFDDTLARYKRIIKEYTPEEFEQCLKLLDYINGLKQNISNFSFREILSAVKESMGISDEEIKEILQKTGLDKATNAVNKGFNKVIASGMAVKESAENGTLKVDAENLLIKTASGGFKYCLRAGNNAKKFAKKAKIRGSRVWKAFSEEISEEDLKENQDSDETDELWDDEIAGEFDDNKKE